MPGTGASTTEDEAKRNADHNCERKAPRHTKERRDDVFKQQTFFDEFANSSRNIDRGWKQFAVRQPHSNAPDVKKIASIPIGLTTRKNRESGLLNHPVGRFSIGRHRMFDRNFCGAPLILRLPRVGLHGGLVFHKRIVGIILKMRGAFEDAGLHAQSSISSKSGLRRARFVYFTRSGGLLRTKAQQSRILVVIVLADKLRRLHSVIHALVEPLSAFRDAIDQALHRVAFVLIISSCTASTQEMKFGQTSFVSQRTRP